MNKNTNKIIYDFIKPYIKWEIISILLIICSTIITLSNPYVIKLIIDVSIRNKDLISLFKFIYVLILLFVCGSVIGIIQSYIYTYTHEKLLYNLRMKLFITIMNKEIVFFDRKQIGELMSRTLNELSDVVNLFTSIIVSIITQVSTFIFTFIIMFSLNKKITFITLLITPLIYLVLKYYNPIFRRINLILMQYYSSISNVLQESILNVKLIKYMNSYRYAERRFSNILHKYIKKTFDNLYVNSISNVLLSFLFYVPSLVLLLYGGVQVIHGDLTIGTIVALSAYINQLFQPIRSLSNIDIELQKSEWLLRGILKL